MTLGAIPRRTEFYDLGVNIVVKVSSQAPVVTSDRKYFHQLPGDGNP
ncbi:hypothetical protein [Nocardia sp. NPDC057272]